MRGKSTEYIPYVRHVTPEIISLSTGALMTMIELEGVSFETADTRDLNTHHQEISTLLRNVADERQMTGRVRSATTLGILF